MQASSSRSILAHAAARQASGDRFDSEHYRNERTGLPLLIYVDDFVAWPGPVQKWLDFHHDLHELAEWHGFGFVSYANAFRDVAHADLLGDTTFKGKWSIDKKDPNKYVADPHPGMSFHIIMSWMMAYYTLVLTEKVCDGTLLSMDSGSSPGGPNHEADTKKRPAIPRPSLTADLLTEQIPETWKDLERTEQERCAAMNTNDGSRCAFVWVANRVSEFRDAKSIQSLLNRYTVQNKDWKAEGNSYRSKHGWVAKAPNATFSLRIPALEMDARYLTILSMKSYGNDWAKSELEIYATRSTTTTEAPAAGAPAEHQHDQPGQSRQEPFRILGYHNSETSVIIPHKFDLGETIPKGAPLDLAFHLVGGKTFKITGMALCSS